MLVCVCARAQYISIYMEYFHVEVMQNRAQLIPLCCAQIEIQTPVVYRLASELCRPRFTLGTDLRLVTVQCVQMYKRGCARLNSTVWRVNTAINTSNQTEPLCCTIDLLYAYAAGTNPRERDSDRRRLPQCSRLCETTRRRL